MSTAPPVGSHVEPGLLRRVLGHVPTTVTVVTSASAAGPVGLVVGSFVSVSLEPPLIGVFVDERSASWPAMCGSGSFTVNVLADDQQALCERFARSGPGKFAGLSWWESPHGNPVLPGTTAWLDCLISQVHRFGDHWFALAEVVGLGGAEDRAPLVFHRGALGSLAPSGRPGAPPARPVPPHPRTVEGEPT